MHTGGGIYAESSRLIINSAVGLLNNVAQDSGGALYLNKGSLLSAKNSILFINNRAGAYGGMYIYACMCVCVYVRVFFKY